jgi:hypothetical protein
MICFILKTLMVDKILKASYHAAPMRFWTTEEDEIMQRFYPIEGSVALSERLGRSQSSVSGRAKVLKLRITSEYHSKIASRGRQREHWAFKGFGRVSASMVSRLRNRNKRKWECTITASYLDSLIVDTCPLSGRALIYEQKQDDWNATASVDRIDSNQGYVEGNVRWIHKRVNLMRRDMSDDDFLGWVRSIHLFYGTLPQKLPALPPVETTGPHARGRGNPKFKGYGRIFLGRIYRARHGAIERGISWTLLDGSERHLRYLDGLITDVCPFSGQPLVFPSHGADTTDNASLDRIDNAKGYEMGNVRWVHKIVNMMRGDQTDGEFMEMIKDIARYRKL